jgi:hypothetical protein
MSWVAGLLKQHRWQDFMLMMLPIDREIGLIPQMEAGEGIDCSERQQILRHRLMSKKESWGRSSVG